MSTSTCLDTLRSFKEEREHELLRRLDAQRIIYLSDLPDDFKDDFFNHKKYYLVKTKSKHFRFRGE